MLTVPAIGPPVAGTSASVVVGGTRIPIAELITGQNGGRTEGVCQNPHVSKCVHVVWRVDGQGLTVAFRIVVGDEGIGGTAVTGRVSLGLWIKKGCDAIVLEGGLEIESVLEGLDLTERSVFAWDDTGPSTVVNL